LQSKWLKNEVGYQMNEKYIGKYFDSMIDKAVTNLEEEAYENVD
jgi:hypothetical protein